MWEEVISNSFPILQIGKLRFREGGPHFSGKAMTLKGFKAMQAKGQSQDGGQVAWSHPHMSQRTP